MGVQRRAGGRLLGQVSVAGWARWIGIYPKSEELPWINNFGE